MSAAGRADVSVLTVVDDPGAVGVVEMIDSVLRQSVDGVAAGIELVVAVVADPRTVTIGHHDERVRFVGAPGSGRAEALDLARRSATADTLIWIDSTAMLEPGAVAALTTAIDAGAQVVYADHTVEGASPQLALKPEFSPERLRSHDYLSPVVTATRASADRAAPPTVGVDGAELHDLALRLTEVADAVVRVPRLVARVTAPVARCDEAHRRVVEAHCRRVGIDADVVIVHAPDTGNESVTRVDRHLDERPLVSVVIPTRGSGGPVRGSERVYVVEAVRSLLASSTYRRLEFVVVADAETPVAVVDELRGLAGDALVVVDFAGPFNFSTKINVGAAGASGELLLLLNDDTELIEPASIGVMVAHLQADDVAMVGAKLLFEDGTLQHGGHVYHHKIHHACLGWPGDHPGPAPLVPLAVERECSGVTAAAALVRRSAFDEVGGFDEAYPLNYNDVDFSLRLRDAGHRIIWTPHASWFHFESRTRDSTLRPDEVERIDARWHHELRNDPYYHPALSPDTGDWTPAVAPSTESAAEPSAPVASDGWRERLVSTVLGPPPARPRGVNLVGYLDATSGLGDRVRVLGDVLDAAGIRHSRWNLDLTDSRRVAPSADRPDDGVVFDTTIAVVTALALPGVEGVFPTLLRDVDRVIGYWFWELDEIPATHRAAIDLVDEIWAPTQFVADAYEAAVDVPVALVPLPVARPRPSTADRATFGFDDATVFVASFDHLSSAQRKHPAGAVEAFRRAFPTGDEPARLVVKSINGHLRPAATAALVDHAAGDPRIELRDEYLDAGDQAALIAAADGFVTLHRSEGLGLHIAEAMWLRTPVVATAYSGSVDLTAAGVDGPVAFEVPARLVPVVDGGEAYRSGRWAEPELDQAAAAMRRIVAGGADIEAMVERAFDRMQRQADPSYAVGTVSDVLARRARPPSRRERVAGAIRRVEARVRDAVARSRTRP